MTASSGPDRAAVDRLRREVARLLATEVVAYRFTPGGWSVSVRGVLTLADGRTVFAKLGDVPDTAHAVRGEIAVYRLLGRRPFMPRLIAGDPEVPVLVVEDLSHAARVPPWTVSSLDKLRRLYQELGATPAPPELPPLERTVRGDGWERVASDPLPARRVVSGEWLDRTLRDLVEIQGQAPAAGDRLVHFDLRSDNLCFLEDRAVAFDWNHAVRGEPSWDRHLIAHTIVMEGGGSPEEVLPDPDVSILAWMAGYLVSRAGLPPPEGAPGVRGFQRAQAEVLLPWVCRLCGLPPPPTIPTPPTPLTFVYKGPSRGSD